MIAPKLANGASAPCVKSSEVAMGKVATLDCSKSWMPSWLESPPLAADSMLGFTPSKSVKIMTVKGGWSLKLPAMSYKRASSG